MNALTNLSSVGAKEGVPTGRERLLVVDDKQEIGRIFRKMLNQLGCQVSVMTDSLEAWQDFSKQPDSYNLVATDMTMQLMTGMEFARRIMITRPDIPIILCTGFSELISEEKAKDLGIKAYITKPLLRDEFARVVRRVREEARS